MPRWRLGVALLVPPPVLDEMNGLRRALGDGSLDRIPPHLTLVPPVNVRVDDLQTAITLLRQAAAQAEPITCELGPVTTFAPDSPTLYLDIDDHSRLAITELRNAVFRPPLERTLTWPFVPHVTLDDNAKEDRIEAAVHALSRYQATIVFDSISLLREGQSRNWDPIADVKLGPPAIVGRGGLPLTLYEGSTVDPVTQSELGVSDAVTDLVITADRDGEVAGVIAAVRRNGAFEVDAIAVRSSERGSGVGRHLVNALKSAVAPSGLSLYAGSERIWCSDSLRFLQLHGISPR